eukprot:scaffold840_cov344-Pavlova_lutheri.AAC.43
MDDTSRLAAGSRATCLLPLAARPARLFVPRTPGRLLFVLLASLARSSAFPAALLRGGKDPSRARSGSVRKWRGSSVSQDLDHASIPLGEYYRYLVGRHRSNLPGSPPSSVGVRGLDPRSISFVPLHRYLVGRHRCGSSWSEFTGSESCVDRWHWRSTAMERGLCGSDLESTREREREIHGVTD